MAVKQYIGARYVPILFGDWDSKVAYAPLTIVLYKNNSYTSKKPVPVGIDIGNTEYWALTGNFNGQVSENTTRISDLTARTDNLEKYPIYNADVETVTFNGGANLGITHSYNEATDSLDIKTVK